MPRASIGPELKKFLREATIAYAEGDMVDFDPPENHRGSIFDMDGFTMVDVWDESEDGRIYNGAESVSKDGDLIWKAGYHGIIAPEASPQEVLTIYGQVLKEPDLELPIRGPHVFEGENFLYAFDSMVGRLSLEQFVVKDYIYIPATKSRVYEGHIIGGYINAS